MQYLKDSIIPVASGFRGLPARRYRLAPNLTTVTPPRHNRIIKLKGKMSRIFSAKNFAFSSPRNSVYKISSYCAVRGAGQASTDTRGCVTLPLERRKAQRRTSLLVNKGAPETGSRALCQIRTWAGIGTGSKCGVRSPVVKLS